MIQARPTTYKGIPMRSRLEARVAAWMDGRGWVWEYEPRAYANQSGQYLPDFRLAGAASTLYLEAKPTMDRAYACMERMQIIWDSDPDAVLGIIVGDPQVIWIAGSDRRWELGFEWSD